MSYDDIQHALALCKDFLRLIKKDVSSGQIRNYGNIMNGLKRLAKPIVSLRQEEKDETIIRTCDHLEDSRKELQDIVWDSRNRRDSWGKIVNRLDDLIVELDGLSELLAEAPGRQAEDKNGLAQKEKRKPSKRKRKAPLEHLKEARERHAACELAKDPNITCAELAEILECHKSTVVRLKAWKNRNILSSERPEGVVTHQKDDSYIVDGVAEAEREN